MKCSVLHVPHFDRAVGETHCGPTLVPAGTCLELKSNPTDHSALREQESGLGVASRHVLGYDLCKNKFINCHSNLMLLLNSQSVTHLPP